MPDEMTLHVYPSDCDSAGHVNHAYMLTMLERARWASLEKHLPFEDYVRRAEWAVVRHIDVSYRAPARPGDDFHIRTGLTSLGNTSFTVKQTAHNQNGTLVCEANVVYVTVDQRGKPMAVPEQWREIFSPWS